MKKYLFFTLLLITTCFFSCSKDDAPGEFEITSPKSLTLVFGATSQISTNSTDGVSYNSENEYHATVSASGLITGKCIGETNIDVKHGNSTNKIKITVIPKSALYTEPDFLFNNTKDQILSRFINPETLNDKSIIYNGAYNGVYKIAYMFENNKCSSIIVLISTLHMNDLSNFIDERYEYYSSTPMDNGTDIMMFLNEDKTMAVGVYLFNTSYLAVMYTPNTYTKGILREQRKLNYLYILNDKKESGI